MSFETWLAFTLFWAIFVTTPGPNAVNCISVGMAVGLPRAFWTVAAILTQASLFLAAAAFGVSAFILAAPGAYLILQLLGAVVLIALGVRGWIRAHLPPVVPKAAQGIYGRAFMVATVNAKSLAGYVAGVSQFIDPLSPIAPQMLVIAPTALCLTALSYSSYVMLGTWVGRAALGAVFNIWVRRALSGCFVLYGLALMWIAISW